MNEACCTIPQGRVEPSSCPGRGKRGKSVEWLTVAALTTGSVPPRQSFWLCRDPECDLVYFGDRGTTLQVEDLNVEPGFKTDMSKERAIRTDQHSEGASQSPGTYKAPERAILRDQHMRRASQ